MLKAVIFDLDDTLISEKEYVISAFNHISKVISNEYNLLYEDIFNELKLLFEESPKNVFNRFFEKHKLFYTTDDINYLIEEYRNHEPNIKFYDDVIPCINTLREKGFKLGIITDGYNNSQWKKLIALNADKLFDEIIVTDDFGREYWKPNPKAFEIIRDRMKIDFSQMVYVGDNPEKDFYISKIYPIITVRINRGNIYENKDYLGNVREHYVISKLDELKEFIF